MKNSKLKRREFLAVGVAASLVGAAASTSAQPIVQEATGKNALRTISYNILACRGFNGKEGDAAD